MTDEYLHDPDAVLDYSKDWSVWLRDGETVESAVWTLPPGVERDPAHPTDTLAGTVSTVWVTGGELNKNYRLTCHVVTSEGREEDDSIILKCRDK